VRGEGHGIEPVEHGPGNRGKLAKTVDAVAWPQKRPRDERIEKEMVHFGIHASGDSMCQEGADAVRDNENSLDVGISPADRLRE
jgi:hypothetical protein